MWGTGGSLKAAADILRTEVELGRADLKTQARARCRTKSRLAKYERPDSGDENNRVSKQYVGCTLG